MSKKCNLISLVFLLFSVLFFFMFAPSEVQASDTTTLMATCFPMEGGVIIGMNGTYYTSSKESIINQINTYRKEACDNGYPDPRNSSRQLVSSDYVPIKWSSALEVMARVRAAEADLYESHTRPNGYSCFSLSYNGLRSSSEVLAWNPYRGERSLLFGIEQWYEEKNDWINQNSNAVTGHYTAMINPDNLHVGVGAFLVDGAYWVGVAGEFSYKSGLDETKNDFTGPCVQLIDISTSSVIDMFLQDAKIYKRHSIAPIVNIVGTIDSPYFGTKEFGAEAFLGYSLTSRDTNIVEANDNVFVGMNYGSTRIDVRIGHVESSFAVEVMSPPTAYNGIDYSDVYDYYDYIDNNPSIYDHFNGDFYKILEHFVNHGMKEGRLAKSSFDVISYKNAYVDLRNNFGNNLTKYYMHYIQHGKKEGRNKTTGISSPIGAVTKLNSIDYSLVYDYNYYISKYPDIKSNLGTDDIKILSHFVNNGMKEGRQAKSSFDVTSYAYKYSDLRRTYKNDLSAYYLHFIKNGSKEGRIATGVNSMQNYTTKYNNANYDSVYDCNYYMNAYPSIKNTFRFDDEQILAHFVNHGMKEGRQAKSSFNVTSYAYRYSDLRNAYKNDLPLYYLHFIKNGSKEGRIATGTNTIQNYVTKYNGTDYKLVYDCNYYINKYPTIKNTFIFDDEKILAHFINHGMKESRQAISTFNVTVYKNNYEDLRKAFGSDLSKYFLHYISNGKSENRKAI